MKFFGNGTPAMPRIRQCGALDDERTQSDIFLHRLDADIRAGRQVRAIPTELARAMLANVGREEGYDMKIEGEVSL